MGISESQETRYALVIRMLHSVRAGQTSVFLFGLVLIGFIYWTPIADILKIAMTEADRGYVIIAPFVAAYLAWLRRSRWRNTRRGPSLLGPPIILMASVVSYVGYDFDVMFMWHSGAVIGFLGLLVSFFGVRLLRDFIVPIIAMFALIPVPGTLREAIAFPLQEAAASLTVLVLNISNINAVQMGNIVEINEVMVTIGEACDGMRLMLPIGLCIYLFVFSLPLKSGTRFILILLSAPVAFLCNVGRLVITALAFGFYPESADIVHDAGGWFVIPCAVISVYGCMRLVQWLDFPVSRWRLAIE